MKATIPVLSPCPFCLGAARMVAYGGPGPMKSFDLPRQRRSLLKFMSKHDGFHAHTYCRACFCHGPIAHCWDTKETDPAAILNELCANAAAKWNGRVVGAVKASRAGQSLTLEARYVG